jgi:hypothetical protein
MAAAISKPFGFTTPAKKKTKGVIANARASTINVDLHQMVAIASARLRSRASMSALMSLMK